MFRISESKLYSLAEPIPNQGILQGNRSRSVTWVATSTLLINCMKEEEHELTMVSIISKEKLWLMGYILVDDMDLIGGKLFESTNDIEDMARVM